MKRAILLSCVMATALGVSALSAQARGFGPGGPGGPGGFAPAFAELDADGDGALTQAELEAFGRARFDAADADSDGFLTPQEMQAHKLEQIKQRMAERNARMLEKKDSDGDGKLSYDEMRPEDSRRDKMFSRLDADGNGEISEAEYDEVRMKMRDHRHGPKGGWQPQN
ncbi:EF-hand domain-containing protein [Shimia sp.]|uniref:EF-hand domain-containing protein n=1 Tax=Shimia sp. TaxID=1954381 RepID=UPI003563F8B9